jgi:hypothetical protein
VREAKKATAGRVLSFRVHVQDSHGPDASFASRGAAEEEAGRLRRSGLEVVVRPVHTPLPTDPWLCIHVPESEHRLHRRGRWGQRPTEAF